MPTRVGDSSGKAQRENTEPRGVQSVDRAVTVLEIIASWGEANVSDVALAVGMHRSSISRLLTVLETREMVERVGRPGRYRLGPNIVRLAKGLTQTLDISVQGAGVCDELSQSIGETINMAINQSGYTVNVYQTEDTKAITVTNWVGKETPYHATSTGKILLASMPENARNRILEGPLPRFNAATITDPRALTVQLEEVKKNGYALALGEFEHGLYAIAVPILGKAGEVIASLSASGPNYRLGRKLMISHVPQLTEAAEKISKRMGFHA